MGYSSPALTCVKASRRKSWRVSIRPVGQRRGGRLPTPAPSHGGPLLVRSPPPAPSQWQAATEEAIIELAAQPEVVAIGECGLDFNRNFSTPEEQERAFVAQLRIAAELNMPVFMHCRDAHERFMTLLEPWLDKLPGAVLHCFTGTREEMQACVARGIYIGITGWVCDERRGLELRELLPLIPAEKLLIETDAPYLLPRDLTPKPSSRRNEPAHLPHILQRIAHWRGEDAAWLAATTDANVKTLFGIAF